MASFFVEFITLGGSLLYFAPLSYKRFESNFDEYGFATASYGSCGDLKETSGTLEKTWIASILLNFMTLLCITFFIYRKIKEFARTTAELTSFQQQLLNEADQIMRVVVIQLSVGSSGGLYFLTLKYPQNQYRRFLRTQVLPMIAVACNLWLISIPINQYLRRQQCTDRGDGNESISIPSLLDLPMLGPVFSS